MLRRFRDDAVPLISTAGCRPINVVKQEPETNAGIAEVDPVQRHRDTKEDAQQCTLSPIRIEVDDTQSEQGVQRGVDEQIN